MNEHAHCASIRPKCNKRGISIYMCAYVRRFCIKRHWMNSLIAWTCRHLHNSHARTSIESLVFFQIKSTKTHSSQSRSHIIHHVRHLIFFSENNFTASAAQLNMNSTLPRNFTLNFTAKLISLIPFYVHLVGASNDRHPDPSPTSTPWCECGRYFRRKVQFDVYECQTNGTSFHRRCIVCESNGIE